MKPLVEDDQWHPKDGDSAFYEPADVKPPLTEKPSG